MNELTAFNEQRAEIYWWLSSLLTSELTAEQLEEYNSFEVRTFLSNLAETAELSSSVSALIEKLNQLQKREDAQLELSADFCQAFLGSDKSSALPYASLYLDKSGLLNAKPAQEMRALLEKYNIAQKAEFNEPADHIAIELDFLGNLIVMTNQQASEEEFEAYMAAQLNFINEQLLSWTPRFSQICQERDEFGFYAAVTHFLVTFLQLDAAFLTGE
ncbi:MULTISPECIES: molecular chaperone TorD [Aliivibrio]|uniref:Chaperone protein TorD n=1 Tax=Aliivibrio finisterrensis TaxID=511998 RepID=A0A4Q5L003_9GAMM|nr:MULTISPECIES: molecular chaperone TorD [Aliivibrio]MDD9180329.1 molecular chaperone TorD [Aliivibrio sp. A6]RYU52930.1 molecular chaperone TorD [Aliivibrio finisterrensis]RYU54655.1 molecular chaperone TorD [Aliivibrio finisterrensis]RYU55236.1 molecular chaperone TorD [Aliivibrio finisterrensis]RYU65328.1 molecular chaperone TorD [Aliivibrio finisterrensis]